MFIVHGYHGLPVRQIAESLGVTKAALYYHFQDKEELFCAVLADYLETMGDLVEGIAGNHTGVRERIHALVEAIFAQPAEDRAVIRLASQEMVHLSPAARLQMNRLYQERFIQPIQQILASGIDSRELRAVDPLLATWVLLGMLYPFLASPGSERAAIAPGEIDHIVGIFLDGIAVPG